MDDTIITDKYKKKIITLPNILSFLRLCLIPVIVWLYIGAQNYLWAAIFVVISGVTDILDGIIARRFNMISDFGKVLDPIADKATQMTMMLLLITRFPLMLLPFIIAVIKEIFMLISGYMVIKKCDVVLGADWHGKAATVVLSSTIFLHFIWYEIIPIVSNITAVLCAAMIILSFVLYAIRNFEYLSGKKTEKDD